MNLLLPRLRPTPRPLPWTLAVQLLVGGGRAQFGFFLAGFGLFLFLVSAPRTDLSGWWRFSSAASTEGTVVETSRTPDVSRRSRWPRAATLQTIRYTYLPDGGEHQAATSYQWGGFRSAGDTVTVQYDLDDPAVSRIRGTWRDACPPWMVFSILLPVVGGMLLAPRIRTGRRALVLAREGSVTTASFWSREDSWSFLGSTPRQHLQYRYRPPEASDDLFVEWEGADPVVLSDGPETPVLYLPDRPEESLLLLTLPAPFRLDEDGGFHALRPERGYLDLVLPILSALAIPVGLVLAFV